MNRGQRKTKIGSVLALLLFGVFALCVLLVLLTGADAYKSLTERGQNSYADRTVAQYITTKVRQADQMGGVSACVFEGRDALVLAEKIDGTAYETRIYYHDGYIRELFAEAGGDLLPEDGEKIIKAKGLLVSPEEPGLYIRIYTAEGEWEELILALRSGEEVSP